MPENRSLKRFFWVHGTQRRRRPRGSEGPERLDRHWRFPGASALVRQPNRLAGLRSRMLEVDTRPAAHEPAPVPGLLRVAAQKGRGGRSGHAPGRPRGSKVIDGRLVTSEQLVGLVARAPE